MKGYGFWSFAKKGGKNICKNISKTLSSKYSQQPLDHAKQSATDALKIASKTAEATGDLTGNEIAGRITKLLKTSPNNSSETNEKEILRKRYISPELRYEIIDDLRLKEENY